MRVPLPAAMMTTSRGWVAIRFPVKLEKMKDPGRNARRRGKRLFFS